MRKYILAINPGSTSTKTALYDETTLKFQQSFSHNSDELRTFHRVAEQFDYRKSCIMDWLTSIGVGTEELRAVVGRGGLLRSMPSGTYVVTEQMKQDLMIGVQGEHASNLGGLIAAAVAEAENIPAYIVDPVAVDEFDDLARLSGLPELPRISLVHALNVRAVARRVSAQLGQKLDQTNLIVAHLGGGITISPLRNGRIVDGNNANEGGPFSPERCGSLPVGELVDLAYSGKYTAAELKKKMLATGGLAGYLGTNDAREVAFRIEAGDREAELILRAMGYQIGKEIGACAAVLWGKVDAVVLTGGLAYSEMLMNIVREMVEFIAPVIVVPGEDEMQSLSEGALRVLSGEEQAKIYENEVFHDQQL